MTRKKAVTKFAGDTKTGRTVNNKRPRSQRLLTKANAIKHYFERGAEGNGESHKTHIQEQEKQLFKTYPDPAAETGS